MSSGDTTAPIRALVRIWSFASFPETASGTEKPIVSKRKQFVNNRKGIRKMINFFSLEKSPICYPNYKTRNYCGFTKHTLFENISTLL
ncbi:hypothetical protein LEP1GSC170_5067 [Leptospira interrogans serovar Bataviae str. HAI135]|nr:hypothetical protein LEP1GSC170_5067 [Leptospira interrogans serovar Bataviae str. HAI135]